MTDKKTVGELALRLGYTNESSVHGENGKKWKKFIIYPKGKTRAYTTEKLILEAIEHRNKKYDNHREFWQFIDYMHKDIKMTRNKIVDYVVKYSGMMEYKNKYSMSTQLHRESMQDWKIEHMLNALNETDLYKNYKDFYNY